MPVTVWPIESNIHVVEWHGASAPPRLLMLAVDTSDSCREAVKQELPAVLATMARHLSARDEIELWLVGADKPAQSRRRLEPGWIEQLQSGLRDFRGGTWLLGTLTAMRAAADETVRSGGSVRIVLVTDGKAFDAPAVTERLGDAASDVAILLVSDSDGCDWLPSAYCDCLSSWQPQKVLPPVEVRSTLAGNAKTCYQIELLAGSFKSMTAVDMGTLGLAADRSLRLGLLTDGPLALEEILSSCGTEHRRKPVTVSAGPPAWANDAGRLLVGLKREWIPEALSNLVNQEPLFCPCTKTAPVTELYCSRCSGLVLMKGLVRRGDLGNDDLYWKFELNGNQVQLPGVRTAPNKLKGSWSVEGSSVLLNLDKY